jgi:hypothetical protein
MEERKTCGHFKQKAHTHNYYINVLNKVLEDRLISRLWPARSPGSNLCDFCLWGNLKSKIYFNNPNRMDEFRHNICETITYNEASEFRVVSNSFFKKIKVCLREGRETL